MSDLSSTENEFEDDDGLLVTAAVDAQILKTIAMVKAKMPVPDFEEGLKETEEEWKRKVEEMSEDDLIKTMHEVSDDELFSKKQKTEEETKKEEKIYKEFIIQNASMDKVKLKKLLKPKDPTDRFLMEYVMNKGWISKEVAKQVESSGSELDQMEEKEYEFNTRYEIMQYPREVPDSKRKTNKRTIKNRNKREKRKQKRQKTEFIYKSQ